MRIASLFLTMIVCTPLSARAVVHRGQNSHAPSAGSGAVSTTTLYPPQDPATGKYLESRAVLSFKPKPAPGGPENWDLAYGFLAINNEDWFEVSHAKGTRSVMKDLGPLEWSDSYLVPALTPLPELRKGEQRHIGVDASGGTHQLWAATTVEFAKVILGHIYEIHVKDEHADFYALFRVEEHKQRDHCRISWKLIDAPPAVNQ